jgi:tetratricopeptide (TPR) repeat protein
MKLLTHPRASLPIWLRSGAAALVAAGLAGLAPALAADSTPEPSAAKDALASARALIAGEKWAAAIDELSRVNDRGNADWNNLMGYAHRKAKTPDYAAAERYYDAALKINPGHRGALEYSGELYLILGDLPRARQRLAALDQACTPGCEELRDLKAAVARFETKGNKLVQK